MHSVIDLLFILEEKIKKLDLQIADVKYERDNSATPMESHSDKSRQLAEQLMDALIDEKKNLISLKRRPDQLGTTQIFSLSTPLGERDFVLVPDGLGGKTVSGVTLISYLSPLGKILKNKKEMEFFVYNGQEFTVLGIKKVESPKKRGL